MKTGMDYKRALLCVPSEDTLYDIGMKFYKKKDYEKAIYYFTKGYRIENTDASIGYAICLYKGKGIEKNKIKAVEILDKFRHIVDDSHICYKIIGDYYYEEAKALIQKTFGNLKNITLIFNNKIPVDIEKHILTFTTICKNTLQINLLLEKTMDYYGYICPEDRKAFINYNHCIALYKQMNNRYPFKNLYFF